MNTRIFRTVNGHINNWIINNLYYTDNMILSLSLNKSYVTDTVFKYMYLYIYQNAIYPKFTNTITPSQATQKMISFIIMKSSLKYEVVYSVLCAIYNLAVTGVFPNNWLNPSIESAKKLYMHLENNPGILDNLVDYALNLVLPVATTTIEVIKPISGGIIAIAFLVGAWFLYPLIKKNKK